MLYGQTEQLVNSDLLNIYETKLFTMAKACLNEEETLLVEWMDLFVCPETTNEDHFASLLLDFFYKITLHFLKIFFGETVLLFKESLPRKKTQALRSKLGSACASKKAKVDKGQESSISQDSFPCGVCGNVCVEQPKDLGDESISCDGRCGGRWFHYKCVGLGGREPFLSRKNSKWLCLDCEKNGKGRGKGKGK
jgi:hypothetical protein